MQWQRLAPSPANSHDCLKLGLLRIKQPLDSSRILDSCSERESFYYYFLIETKCFCRVIDKIKPRIEWQGTGVDACGKSDGIALVWDKALDVLLYMFSSNFIDTIVNHDGSSWRHTGFYGDQDPLKKKNSWDMSASFALNQN